MPSTDLVCDASALIELLTGGDRAITVAEAMTDRSVHAPHLVVFETLQRLRIAERESFISIEAALEAKAFLVDLSIEYWPMGELADRVWELRHNLSAYDASYVALAELLESPLLTADARMSRAPGPHCEFIVL